MEREVIVVGAGPGGATAAMSLAQKGHDVLLLDRHTFPRDKTCGDGIPGGAIDILARLGMREKITQAGFYPARSMLLVSPSGHDFSAPFKLSAGGSESYIVPRLQFDQVLVQHAVDSGAEFVPGQAMEPLMERGRVTGIRARLNGKIQDIRAQLVIAADGATSVIARALRPDKQEDMHKAVAIRAYLEDFEEFAHQIEFYLYNGVLPGYAWIFPTGKGQANIGLGMRVDHFRRMKGNLEKMLDNFMGMPDIKKRLKPTTRVHSVMAWQLPFGSQRMQRAYEGALLVGDAAGLINPLTGGGIHNAIISGDLAAAAAHDAIQANDITRQRLKQYETLCDEAMWESMRNSFLLQHWLFRFPLLVDFLIKYMGANSRFAQTFLTKL